MRCLQLALFCHDFYCLDHLWLAPTHQLAHLLLDLVVGDVEPSTSQVSNEYLQSY